jgi:hypothetical protein
MNCLPSSSLRREQSRFEPRIIDSREDFEADDFNDDTNPFVDEIAKAKRMENILTNAVDLAERNTGSILCFQNVSSKSSAVQLGRRISSIRSIEKMALSDCPEDHDTITSDESSFNSAKSFPTFLRVEKGDPAVLAQKSWDSLWSSSNNDGDDNVRGASAPDVDDKVLLPTRSWNKLRRSLGKEAEEASNAAKEAERSTNCFDIGGSVKNRQDPRKGIREQTANSGIEGLPQRSTEAKDLSVEIALKGKKTRWGHLGRREKCVATKPPYEGEKVPIEMVKKMDSEEDVDKTQEVSFDVSSIDETGNNDESIELSEQSLGTLIPERKRGWGWRKNKKTQVLARPCLENKEALDPESTVGHTETDFAGVPAESPRLLQIDNIVIDGPDDKLKSTFAYNGEMRTLGQAGKPSDMSAAHPAVNNLSVEESQSMECVWLSGFL